MGLFCLQLEVEFKCLRKKKKILRFPSRSKGPPTRNITHTIVVKYFSLVRCYPKPAQVFFLAVLATFAKEKVEAEES